jgi:hypothetical protein
MKKYAFCAAQIQDGGAASRLSAHRPTFFDATRS